MHLKVFGAITLLPQQVKINGWKWLPGPGFWKPSQKKNQYTSNFNHRLYINSNGINILWYIALQAAELFLVKFYKQFIFDIIKRITLLSSKKRIWCHFDVRISYIWLHVIIFFPFSNLKSTNCKTYHSHIVHQITSNSLFWWQKWQNVKICILIRSISVRNFPLRSSLSSKNSMARKWLKFQKFCKIKNNCSLNEITNFVSVFL